MYRLRLAINLEKTCKKFPQKDKLAIYQALKDLEIDPRPMGSIKLTGREGYRFRVGEYRILYKINDNELLVLVIDIDNRASVYKKR